jgi:hypothetical protein
MNYELSIMKWEVGLYPFSGKKCLNFPPDHRAGTFWIGVSKKPKDIIQQSFYIYSANPSQVNR